MKICIATNSFYPAVGGIATFYSNLSYILTSHGHEVFILTIDEESSEEDEEIKEEQITKVILKKSYQKLYKNYNSYFSPGGFDAPKWISTGLAMKDWLLKKQSLYKFDIIEASDYGGIACFFINEALPPVAITAHGSLLQLSEFNNKTEDRHYKMIVELEKLSFQYADLVLPYSPLNQKKLSLLFKRRIDFATAPWGTGNFKSNEIAETGLPLVVGGLQKIKGAEILIEALSLLNNNNIKVEWIGGDFFTAPPGGVSTVAYLKDKFAGSWNKTFLWKNEQSRNETKKALSQSQFIIIPSLFETFSYVAVEAATIGKALIITETTGASYLFTHGHDAWIIPANNTEKLAEAILHLNNDPELCKKLGANASQTIEHIFDQTKIADERITLYKNAILDRNKIAKISPELAFINNYTSWYRKYYYLLRKKMKKIIKG